MLCLKLKWPRLSAINRLKDSEAGAVLGALGLLVGWIIAEDVLGCVVDEVVRALGRSGAAHLCVAE
eukprot:10637468-Alexandrium_andersonii.AAC.1